MSLEALLIIIGILLAALPFVGLPQSVMTWVGLLLGLATLGIGVLLRARLSRGNDMQPRTNEEA